MNVTRRSCVTFPARCNLWATLAGAKPGSAYQATELLLFMHGPGSRAVPREDRLRNVGAILIGKEP